MPSQDGQGEVSLSIEETNKLRASLGLPPLKIENSSDRKGGETQEEEAKKRKRDEDEKDEIALEDRIQQARQRRRQEELLRNTEGLGAVAEDVDDVMAWVNKTRNLGKSRRSVEGNAVGMHDTRTRRKNDLEEQSTAPSEVKVKHIFDEMAEGEEVVLTLEDKPILNEKGELDEDDDTLEHVLSREVKERERAYAASKKQGKPLWEEDGKKRSILDKYDEEEEQALSFDDLVSREADRAKRKIEIKARLAAFADELGSDPTAGKEKVESSVAVGGDYYTTEEMEAMESLSRKGKSRNGKKKAGRKLKRKALTEDDLLALEAEAANGSTDLASRDEREKRAAQRKSDFETAEASQRSKFAAALAKANAASAALRADALDVQDDDEGEFFASLSRAAAIAAKKRTTGPSLDTAEPSQIAEQLAKRREEEAKRSFLPANKDIVFSEISEFARAIQPRNEASAQDTLQEEPPTLVTDESMQTKEANGFERAADRSTPDVQEVVDEEVDVSVDKGEKTVGQWVHEGEKGPEREKDSKQPFVAKAQRSYRRRHAVNDEDGMQSGGRLSNTAESEDLRSGADSVVAEKAVGRGLGSALSFLKERGELNRSVEWAGRTTDSRDSYFTKAMGGFKDVFTGGSSEDALARDVEIALTRKDKYGRILTPKEAWRQLCHDFHGNGPSRNTQEKRAKQMQRELAQKKSATGMAEREVLTGLKAVQKQAAAPFVVLSGTVKPGQTREAGKGWSDI